MVSGDWYTNCYSLDYLDGRTLREFVVSFLRAAGSRSRYHTLQAMFEASKPAFGIDQDSSSAAEAFLREHSVDEARLVADAARELATVQESQWSFEALKETVTMIAESTSQGKYGIMDGAERLADPKKAYAALLQWIRWAVVRAQTGPSMIIVMSVYGRRVTLQRLEAAQQLLQGVEADGNKRQATRSGQS